MPAFWLLVIMALCSVWLMLSRYFGSIGELLRFAKKDLFEDEREDGNE